LLSVNTCKSAIWSTPVLSCLQKRYPILCPRFRPCLIEISKLWIAFLQCLVQGTPFSSQRQIACCFIKLHHRRTTLRIGFEGNYWLLSLASRLSFLVGTSSELKELCCASSSKFHCVDDCHERQIRLPSSRINDWECEV
jgi:hypothetical protein